VKPAIARTRCDVNDVTWARVESHLPICNCNKREGSDCRNHQAEVPDCCTGAVACGWYQGQQAPTRDGDDHNENQDHERRQERVKQQLTLSALQAKPPADGDALCPWQIFL